MKNELSLFKGFLEREKILLLLIVILAFIVRLYRINYPLADWHSFRQADTASVTREYVKHGIDLLHPRYHDLSNIQSGERTGGLDNVEGWRMVEFPFINGMIATFLRVFPSLSLVVTSRFFSIVFSLGTLISLYYLIKVLSSTKVALISSFIFALLPYSIFYSRVILPEPFMLFFSTFSILSFTYWTKQKGDIWLIGSAVSLALALLLKPFVAFLAPVYAVICLQHLLHITSNKRSTKNLLFLFIKLLVFVAVSLIPLLLWRNWIEQFPSGIPASDWLFNSNQIRFRPAWFRWLLYERIVKLMLGYVGISFLFIGLIPFNLFDVRSQKSKVKNTSKKLKTLFRYLLLDTYYLILISWWFGILLYFSVIATGNVQHDYYQVLTIPILCWTIGLGIYNSYFYIVKWTKNFQFTIFNFQKDSQTTIQNSELLASLLVGILVVCSLFFSWQQLKGYFNVNNWEYIEAGQAVDRLTPPNAKVIAPAFGDTVFLFQTNRTGWPIGFDIEQKINNGAEYYVTTSYDDEARELEAQYEIVEKTDKYLILNLTRTIGY